MKHTNTFRIECCANRRALVNDVLVCARCDLPGAIPNWNTAKMPSNDLKVWTPKKAGPA